MRATWVSAVPTPGQFRIRVRVHINWNTLFGSEFNKIVSYWVVDPDASLLGGGGHGFFSNPT